MSLQVQCDYDKCDTLIEEDTMNKIIGFLTLEANGKYTPEKYHFCSWECLANSALLDNKGCNGHAGQCPAGNNGVSDTLNNQKLLPVSSKNIATTVETTPSAAKTVLAVAEGEHENSQTSLNAEQVLTERQQTVLRLLADGYTNAQIASRIGYSESTVHMETLTIYRFLNVHSRKEAAEVAKINGLIPHIKLQEAS